MKTDCSGSTARKRRARWFASILDAERAFVQTNNEYRGALVAYWSSVFQLEAAIGSELTA